MNISEVKHICFDKDGTLTDVHLYWSDIVSRRAEHLVRHFSLPMAMRERLSHRMGVDPQQRKICPGGPVGYKPRAVVIESVLGELSSCGVNTSQEEISRIFETVDSQMKAAQDYRLQLLPFVKEVLIALKQYGFVLSVYSSDRSGHLQSIFEKLDLAKCFDALIGGDDVCRPKPHEEGFVVASRRVAVPLANSLYVGDTPDDIKMAAGCFCLGAVAVLTGLGKREELCKGALHVVADLKEFLSLVKRKPETC